MNVILAPELQKLLHEKLQSGEHRSADEVINAALRLLQQHDEDRQVLLRVNAGEALPVEERFDARLEMLLQEAEDSGEPSEMTPQDWDDIRQEGLALIKSANRPGEAISH